VAGVCACELAWQVFPDVITFMDTASGVHLERRVRLVMDEPEKEKSPALLKAELLSNRSFNGLKVLMQAATPMFD